MADPEGVRVEVEQAHRWFEYGRWFYGFGSSFDPHICGEEGVICEWRERTITVGPWSEWTRPDETDDVEPDPPYTCECCKPRPTPPPLPLHRTEAGYPYCSTCDGGGCLDCTDPA